QVRNAYDIELPLDVPEMLTIADAPPWVEEAWWGEEYRGTKLDSPEAIAAAKKYLASADCETDGPHRIAKEIAKIDRRLKHEDLDDEDRRELEKEREYLEEEEPEYENTSEVAGGLLDLGLSQVRATTLMRVYWNPRNRPALPDALLRELVAWRWEFRAE